MEPGWRIGRAAARLTRIKRGVGLSTLRIFYTKMVNENEKNRESYRPNQDFKTKARFKKCYCFTSQRQKTKGQVKMKLYKLITLLVLTIAASPVMASAYFSLGLASDSNNDSFYALSAGFNRASNITNKYIFVAAADIKGDWMKEEKSTPIKLKKLSVKLTAGTENIQAGWMHRSNGKDGKFYSDASSDINISSSRSTDNIYFKAIASGASLELYAPFAKDEYKSDPRKETDYEGVLINYDSPHIFASYRTGITEPAQHNSYLLGIKTKIADDLEVSFSHFTGYNPDMNLFDSKIKITTLNIILDL